MLSNNNSYNDELRFKNFIKIIIPYGILISLIIFIVELIIKNYTFNYSISFVIGLIISILSFSLTSFIINKATFYVEKARFILITLNLVKLIIYGLTMYLVLISPLKYGIYTCAFGLFTTRICILIKYQIIEPIEDKKRLIKNLDLDDQIKNKLLSNQIFKVDELVLKSRIELLSFLNDKEIDSVNNSLKMHGLFLKGEIEVIKYEDSNDE